MNSIPLIRASAPKRFALFLERIGAPVASLWDHAGLPMHALEEGAHEESPVSLHHGLRFIEHAARVEGVSHLGILAAQESAFASNSGFFLRISRARTLSEAFATIEALVRAHNSGAQYWIKQQGDRVRICRRMTPDAIPSPQSDLFTVMMMVGLVRQAAGPEWRPKEVSLQSICPDGLTHIEALAEARIVSGRPATSIALPRSLLARPLGGGARSAARAAPDEEDRWLASAPSLGFVGSLQALVESLLPVRVPEIEIAAEAARTSVRSLQRRLTAEGTSYARVVDDVRFASARRMLEESDLKLLEIAYELGYSDPAHFSRAFRRWTSVAPGEYRRLFLRQGKSERTWA
jgi:AraC-like DNA-binding protein